MSKEQARKKETGISIGSQAKNYNKNKKNPCTQICMQGVQLTFKGDTVDK